LEIAACFRSPFSLRLKLGFLEHPLDGAVKQGSMWKLGNLAIEPEMNSGDRGTLKTGKLGPKLSSETAGSIFGRQQFAQRLVWNCEHDEIEALWRSALDDNSVAICNHPLDGVP